MDNIHKCQNFKICMETLPKWWHDYKNKLVCIKCDMELGEWNNDKETIKEYPNTKCTICLESKLCFEQPKCNHPICSNCFRIVYFGEFSCELIDSIIGKEPVHPYQHLLDQSEILFSRDIENDPLNINWKIKYDKWFNSKEYLTEQLSSRNCCLCKLKND